MLSVSVIEHIPAVEAGASTAPLCKRGGASLVTAPEENYTLIRLMSGGRAAIGQCVFPSYAAAREWAMAQRPGGVIGEVAESTARNARLREILGTLGLDHFPSLGGARQVATARPDEASVKLADLTSPHLMYAAGVVVFCFPDPTPDPTPAELVHTLADAEGAVAQAREFRRQLSIEGEASPVADPWRLAEMLLAENRFTIRRTTANVGGRCLSWQEGPPSITLPERFHTAEEEASTLLLLIGYALWPRSGPAPGWDYDNFTPETRADRERETQARRMVALTFRDMFLYGEWTPAEALPQQIAA